LDAYAPRGPSSFQRATPEDLVRPALPQNAREHIPSLNDLPSQPTVANGEPRCVSEESAQLELERQLSAALTERDQRVAQLTREHADRLLAQTLLVEKKDAELVGMRAKLDESLQSRDQHTRALEQALQKATSRAAEADGRSQRALERIGQYETELAEVRAELGASKSELEAVRHLRLTDAENGSAESKTEADLLNAPTTAGLVSTDEDPITHGLVERIRAMEGEMASLRLGEKSSEAMQSRNEG